MKVAKTGGQRFTVAEVPHSKVSAPSPTLLKCMYPVPFAPRTRPQRR